MTFARFSTVTAARRTGATLTSGSAMLVSVLLTVACASTGPGDAPSAPSEPEPSGIGATGIDMSTQDRTHAAALLEENRRLEQALEAMQSRLAELEERYAALETELASAVEEVLRSKAAMSGVHNRALAVSRISEVRVAVQSLEGSVDGEVQRRLARATDFLYRADTALAEENYGGASFLAERASELVRQARTVADIRDSAVGADVLPIVPPRDLEVISAANLRVGPGVETERVGRAEVGDHLRALARAGQWFHIETATGVRAWVHSTLVH